MSEISSNMTSIVPDNNRKRQSRKRGPGDKVMLAPLFWQNWRKWQKISHVLQGIKKIKQTTTKKTAKIQLNRWQPLFEEYLLTKHPFEDWICLRTVIWSQEFNIDQGNHVLACFYSASSNNCKSSNGTTLENLVQKIALEASNNGFG